MNILYCDVHNENNKFFIYAIRIRWSTSLSMLKYKFGKNFNTKNYYITTKIKILDFLSLNKCFKLIFWPNILLIFHWQTLRLKTVKWRMYHRRQFQTALPTPLFKAPQRWAPLKYNKLIIDSYISPISEL